MQNVINGASKVPNRFSLFDGNMIHDFDKMVIAALEQLENGQNGDEDNDKIDWTDIGNDFATMYNSPPPKRTRMNQETPCLGETGPDIDDETNDIVQLGKFGGDEDDGDDDGDMLGGDRTDNNDRDEDGDRRSGGEFRLVNFRKITISLFHR